jgi:hypothetical protein
VSPRELYPQRLSDRKGKAAALRRRELRISVARIVFVAAAIGIAFFKLAVALIRARAGSGSRRG